MPTTVTIPPNLSLPIPFSDSRNHGYQGPSRYVRLPRVAPTGGATISKSEDGTRCAVAGKESLRIARISNNSDHKSATEGVCRIEGSRNFWENSGLKIDSASTDIAWGHGLFSNKILTSARNGEIILWDLGKSGAKYERRTKDHMRSINKLSVSPVVHYYCITGSADGDMRIWDLRDLSKSVMRIKHPTSVRSIVFSPSVRQPLQAVVGLDNGSIYRWDLKMGQRGQLDRLAVAHSAPVTTLDWCGSSTSGPGAGGPGGQADANNGLGWLVSGGLDRCVKVWDLTSPDTSAHISSKPTYTLHPSFPVRRVSWRPGYECELAVVSNEEFAVPPLETQPSNTPTSTQSQGLLSRVGSGLGLDVMIKGFNSDFQYATVSGEAQPTHSTSYAADAIEIWDVRREWVAKWSVNGTSLDGSISDIAFGDSHALWAQHSSGTFSQFDLRETSKPIDSISRVSGTWGPRGSLAFITDHRSRWETPYDDIQQVDPRPGSESRGRPPRKALGDPPVRLSNQVLGIYVPEDLADDQEVFIALTRGYGLQGSTKQDICESNAKIACQVGRDRAVQTWSLMASAFTSFIPPPLPTLPASPRTKTRKGLPIILQPPATPANGYSFPPVPTPGSDSLPRRSPAHKSRSLSSTNSNSRSRSVSMNRHLTPSSSKSNSPLHIPNNLPPITPSRSTFSRRESVDSGVLRHPSTGRRPSISGPSGSYVASPGEKPSSASLKHVGEGALDSSSSSEEEPLTSETGLSNLFDEGIFNNLTSPLVTLGKPVATPSPLSRVVGQNRWTEDEDDGDLDKDDEDETSSPSPRSTDTESDRSSSTSRRRAKFRAKRNSFRIKTRSRSSTLASLPASGSSRLFRRESLNSIRTVTAMESNKDEDESRSLHREETIMDLGHRRQKSCVVSDPPHGELLKEDDGFDASQSHVERSKRHLEIIRAEEQRFKNSAWDIVKKALEGFAEEGDVQMCAMVSLLAHEELEIPLARVCRFVEGYIERLTKAKLFTCAAYLRKFSDLESIRVKSLEQTVLYTTCAKCYKPLIRPAFNQEGGALVKGAFSYCTGCRVPNVSCSICRLPVKTLLFQCSICKHGGHQSCYRRYYLQQAMVDLPASFLPQNEDRGRSLARQMTHLSEDDHVSVSSTRGSIADTTASVNQSPSRTDPSVIGPKLVGHPCAAGCGHYCWAANGVLDDMEI
ncbi:WD40 repeat-like protein [Coprinopsis marcescibilis]|uniref:WD40 repeat-like protein n=1 Tax=Coprinopsis marcescibilis TaxID=230819 RepID=A0A5C3KKE7_COPMA|nr:WD40 repeat-like protein [Coprinopsis marcescibilis]